MSPRIFNSAPARGSFSCFFPRFSQIPLRGRDFTRFQTPLGRSSVRSVRRCSALKRRARSGMTWARILFVLYYHTPRRARALPVYTSGAYNFTRNISRIKRLSRASERAGESASSRTRACKSRLLYCRKRAGDTSRNTGGDPHGERNAAPLNVTALL